MGRTLAFVVLWIILIACAVVGYAAYSYDDKATIHAGLYALLPLIVLAPGYYFLDRALINLPFFSTRPVLLPLTGIVLSLGLCVASWFAWYLYIVITH